MPKSKRAKVVALTKTQAKGREGKSGLIADIQKFAEEYKTIYIFSVHNMRTNLFQKIREQHRETSKFYMGKKSLVKVAFGRTKEDSYIKDLYLLGKKLDDISSDEAEIGILFTNEKPSVIEKSLSKISESEFARGGFRALYEYIQPMGELEGYPTSMYEQLRKLKLPVAINKGIVEMTENHVVCKEGDILTPEQAEALKLFGVKMAKFEIVLLFKYASGKLSDLRK